MKMIKYFIPYVYGINTRSKTILHKGSFIVLFLFPILTACIFAAFPNIGICFFLRFFSALTSMYCVYEIGYLYNDVITTQKEKEPSYWIPKNDREYVGRHFGLLVAIRVVTASVCIGIMVYLNSSNMIVFVYVLILLYLFFALHNAIRNRINLLTNMGLQTMKYFAVVICFCRPDEFLKYLIIIFMEVPLERSIEFLAKKRMKIEFIQKINMNIFRILYHFIVTVFAIISYFYTKNHIFILLGATSMVLLMFRLASYFVLKSPEMQRLRFKNFSEVK